MDLTVQPTQSLAETKKILIADDDPELLHILQGRLSRLGHDVSTVTNGLSALVKLVKMPPDLFIVDLNMPGENGLSLCEHITSRVAQTIPTILLTGISDETTLRRCREIGALYLCKGPDLWQELQPLVSKLLAAEQDKKLPEGSKERARATVSSNDTPKILLVDDEPHFTAALAIRLQDMGAETIEATSGMQGLMLALSHHPDLILTDYDMPDGTANYLIMRLQQGTTTSKIPIIVISGKTLNGRPDDGLQRELLSRNGVVAYHIKPLDFDLLLEDITIHVKKMRRGTLLRAAR